MVCLIWVCRSVDTFCDVLNCLLLLSLGVGECVGRMLAVLSKALHHCVSTCSFPINISSACIKQSVTGPLPWLSASLRRNIPMEFFIPAPKRAPDLGAVIMIKLPSNAWLDTQALHQSSSPSVHRWALFRCTHGNKKDEFNLCFCNKWVFHGSREGC